MKPRSAGYVRRWASKVMHHFVRFHVLPSVPSRLPAVAPVSARRVVPSLRSRCVRRRLAFSAFAWRRAVLLWRQRFYPFHGRKLRLSLAVTARCDSFGRPLSLGRAAGVALVRRVSSSARRGRRIASADFHSTGVACGGGGFVSRRHRGSSALALARFLGAPRVQPRGPTRRSTPFPSVTGRCAIKPRSAGHLARWGAESMRHFASSHIQPFAPSPACLVVPVREVSAVPSLPHTRRFAAACASFWRPRRGAPLEASAQVRASRGQASACVGGHGSVVSLGRPLLLGRLARVTRIRRVPSSAHRGRRIASADSCATWVACDGRAFVSRIRIAHSALAPAHVVPASPVNRSAPTHRSRGRCAMKPRSAPELKR
jgi:hypothetical protein